MARGVPVAFLTKKFIVANILKNYNFRQEKKGIQNYTDYIKLTYYHPCLYNKA